MRRRKLLLATVLAAVVGYATLAPSPVEAQYEGFLLIPRLPGESTVEGHEDEIALISYTQTAAPNACLRVTVIKNLDRASPGLALLAVTNRVVSQMRVTLVKGGDRPFEAFVALLESVTVGNVELVEVDGTPLPTERVLLRPRRATLTYNLQRPDGSAGGSETRVINCP